MINYQILLSKRRLAASGSRAVEGWVEQADARQAMDDMQWYLTPVQHLRLRPSEKMLTYATRFVGVCHLENPWLESNVYSDAVRVVSRIREEYVPHRSRRPTLGWKEERYLEATIKQIMYTFRVVRVISVQKGAVIIFSLLFQCWPIVRKENPPGSKK